MVFFKTTKMPSKNSRAQQQVKTNNKALKLHLILFKCSYENYSKYSTRHANKLTNFEFTITK